MSATPPHKNGEGDESEWRDTHLPLSASYADGGVMAGTAALQCRSSFLLQHEDARLESRGPNDEQTLNRVRRS